MVKLQASADCPYNVISIGHFPAIHVKPGAEVEVPDELVNTLLATEKFTRIDDPVAD
jgi:hypothetical protein